MRMAISASIHARWGHRVDGLVHTHAWKVGATVSGPVDAKKIFPAAPNFSAISYRSPSISRKFA